MSKIWEEYKNSIFQRGASQLALTFIFSMLFVKEVFGVPFQPPPIPDGETREYSVRRQEKSTVGLKSLVRAGEEVKRISVTAKWRTVSEGKELEIKRIETRERGHSCVWTFVFAVIGKALMSRSYTMEIRSPDGKLLRKESAKMFGDGTEDVVHFVAVSEVLRGLNFKAGYASYIKMWNPEGGSSLPMKVSVMGIHDLSVPAGKYRAWQVTMALDSSEILGKWRALGVVLNTLMPIFTYWFAESVTHPLVRFEGQFGPKTSAPIEIHELEKIKP